MESSIVKAFQFASFVVLGSTLAFSAPSHAAPARHTNDDLSTLNFEPFSTSKASKYATKAKVAAYYFYDNKINNGIIQSEVNVAPASRRVSTGDVCIIPTVTLKQKLTFPQVTVDYSASIGTGLFAYARATRPNCPNGIEVVTYALSGGEAVLSDNVGFYLFVY